MIFTDARNKESKRALAIKTFLAVFSFVTFLAHLGHSTEHQKASDTDDTLSYL